MKLNSSWLFLAATVVTGSLLYADGNPCANQSPGGPSQPPGCTGGSGGGGSNKPCPNEDSSPPPNDCNGTNFFSAYSGNAHRHVSDLRVFGSVGEMPLLFARYSNTRLAPQATSQGRFGREGVWTHNYQWFMRNGGTAGNGQPQLRVGTPSGADLLFVQDVNDPTLWVGTSNANWEIRQDSMEYALRNSAGEVYRFQQRTNTSSGAIFYRTESMEDVAGNVYTFSYSNANDTLLRQVTDPTGRWLKLTYLNQGGFAQQRVTLGSSPADTTTGVWNEITVTSTTACRFLTLFYANDFSNDPALPVAELEFYDENDQLITGTPFGSDPAFAAGEEADKAFDGDTATYYRYAYMRNGYVGIDAGTARTVSKIRFFIPSGVAASVASAAFIGMNDTSSANWVVKEVEASDGRSVVYNYSIFEDPSTWFRWGTLTSVSYPDSTVAVYSYTQVHEFTRPILEHCIDPRIVGQGTTMQYVFDPDTALGFLREERSGLTGETIASTDFISAHKPQAVYPNGAVVNFQFNLTNANLAKEVDAAGGSTAWTYADAGAGHVETRKDARGFTTSYARTPLGSMLSKTYPDTTVETWTRDSRDRVLTHTLTGPGIQPRTTTYTRDASGRVVRVDHPDATFELWIYNAFGQVLTHQQRNGGVETSVYSTTGLLISYTNAAGETTAYSHNSLDLVATVTDPRGNTTAYTYNDRGQVTLLTQPDASTQGFVYDDNGNLIQQSNELGNVWASTYDEFKRLTSTTDPLNRTTLVAYGEPGGGCSACNTESKPILITLPTGRQQKFAYDLKWNLITRTEGYGTPQAATTTLAYDLGDNATAVMDPEGNTTTMAYDNRGRRIWVKDALLRRTDYTYDAVGNQLTHKRPGNVLTTFTYDSMNRRLSTVDPKMQTTSFQYDAEGNLTHLTDARGNTYVHAYDLVDRQTQLAYPDGSFEAWTYDAAGNRLTQRTRAGQVMTATLDERDRETAQTWSGGAPSVSRSFDAAGRLLSSSNGNATTSYGYNAANELITETQATAGAPAAWTLTYAYNADGLRQSVAYPGGEVIETAYTVRNEVETISAGGPPPLAAYSYDLAGRLAQKTLENGTTASYVYDVAHQLLNVTQALGTTAFARRDYTYNPRGLRTAMQVDAGAWDVYGYDLTDQVTSVKHSAASSTGTTPASTMAYTYDAVGNRTQAKRTGTGLPTLTDVYTTASSVNQYPAVNAAAVTYDANGNLTSAPANIQQQSSAQSASYDAQNRLLGITTGSGTVTQAYDTKNRVVSRTINGVTTYLLWDGWNLVEERDASGNEVRRYVHGAGVDEILAMIDAGGAHYHHHDALGNVIALTDATGTLEETYRYDAFGKATVTNASTSATGDASFFGNRFLYTGREWIAEAGLYDYRNRVYSAALGRFMQTDPILFAAEDVNVYRYVGNSAQNFTDPQGSSQWRPVPGKKGWFYRHDPGAAQGTGGKGDSPHTHYRKRVKEIGRRVYPDKKQKPHGGSGSDEDVPQDVVDATPDNPYAEPEKKPEPKKEEEAESGKNEKTWNEMSWPERIQKGYEIRDRNRKCEKAQQNSNSGFPIGVPGRSPSFSR